MRRIDSFKLAGLERLEPKRCLASVTFTAHDIECCGTRAVDVATADLDGDGDVDIVSMDSQRLEWRENLGPKGFQPPNVISTQIQGNNTLDVIAADVDGDRDIDLVTAEFKFGGRNGNVNKVSWYENDGTGVFSGQKLIASDLDGTSTVYAADLDGDGDQDVAATSFQDGRVVWYENQNGQGQFGSENVIASLLPQPWSIVSGDVDADGDLDLMTSAHGNGTIYLFENINGQGSFSDQPRVATSDMQGIWFAEFADLDADGDLDIVSAASVWPDTSNIAWLENQDGEGTFGDPQIISTDLTRAFMATTDDMDGDGDLDIVATSNGIADVAWFENIDGQGTFSSERYLQFDSMSETRSIATADLDGDGDADVVTSEVAWYKNFDAEFQRFPLSSNFRAVEDVDLADINNDGNLDAIVANGTRLVWYDNQVGTGELSEPQVIFDQNNFPVEFTVADFDADNDLDIVAANFDAVQFVENLDGAGNFAEPVTLAESEFGINPTIQSADIDNDGDLDIMFSYTFDDQFIGWFENRGGGDFSGFTKITEQNDVFITSFSVGDLNGDRYLDIVAASSRDESIVWYASNKNGTFGQPQPITPSDDESRSVVVVDIDSDGDLDILSASYYFEKLMWRENTDGKGAFSKEHLIESLAQPNEILEIRTSTADLDRDGDPDVILESSRIDRDRGRLINEVFWYENDGSGAFGEANVLISQTGDRSSKIASAIGDIDRDGDLDVLTSIDSGGRLSWFKNRIPGDANDDGVFNSADLVAVFQAGEYEDGIEGNSTFAEGDWNGDGDVDSADLVFAFQANRYVHAANGGPSRFEVAGRIETASQINPKSGDFGYEAIA